MNEFIEWFSQPQLNEQPTPRILNHGVHPSYLYFERRREPGAHSVLADNPELRSDHQEVMKGVLIAS
jgi:hypothetical protein